MNLCLGSVSSSLPTSVKDLGYSDANAQLYSVPPYACSLGVSESAPSSGQSHRVQVAHLPRIPTVLLLTSISDRLRTRGVFVMLVYCIGITGWAILWAVDPVGVTAGGLRARCKSSRRPSQPARGADFLLACADFACCCLASAGYANIPLLMAWISANSPSESQRAVSPSTPFLPSRLARLS